MRCCAPQDERTSAEEAERKAKDARLQAAMLDKRTREEQIQARVGGGVWVNGGPAVAGAWTSHRRSRCRVHCVVLHRNCYMGWTRMVQRAMCVVRGDYCGSDGPASARPL